MRRCARELVGSVCGARRNFFFFFFLVLLQSAARPCNQLNMRGDLICHGAIMRARVFPGQDGGYGLESEQVILAPEDENPLRRILQVHTISTIHLTVYFYRRARTHARTDTDMHINKTEYTLRSLCALE